MDSRLRGQRSAGQEGEVTGVHDEAGVQVSICVFTTRVNNNVDKVLKSKVPMKVFRRPAPHRDAQSDVPQVANAPRTKAEGSPQPLPGLDSVALRLYFQVLQQLTGTREVKVHLQSESRQIGHQEVNGGLLRDPQLQTEHRREDDMSRWRGDGIVRPSVCAGGSELTFPTSNVSLWSGTISLRPPSGCST